MFFCRFFLAKFLRFFLQFINPLGGGGGEGWQNTITSDGVVPRTRRASVAEARKNTRTRSAGRSYVYTRVSRAQQVLISQKEKNPSGRAFNNNNNNANGSGCQTSMAWQCSCSIHYIEETEREVPSRIWGVECYGFFSVCIYFFFRFVITVFFFIFPCPARDDELIAAVHPLRSRVAWHRI